MQPEKDIENEILLDTTEVRRRLEEIDGTLEQGIQEDARCQSGVPEEQRGSDIDFIQMTGLTRPMVSPHATETQQEYTDLNPTAPVSFYEAGVRDVDHTLDKNADAHMEAPVTSAYEEANNMAEEALPAFGAVEALRELVADLSQEESPETSTHAQAEESLTEPEEPTRMGAGLDESVLGEPEESALIETPEPWVEEPGAEDLDHVLTSLEAEEELAETEETEEATEVFEAIAPEEENDEAPSELSELLTAETIEESAPSIPSVEEEGEQEETEETEEVEETDIPLDDLLDSVLSEELPAEEITAEEPAEGTQALEEDVETDIPLDDLLSAVLSEEEIAEKTQEPEENIGNEAEEDFDAWLAAETAGGTGAPEQEEEQDAEKETPVRTPDSRLAEAEQLMHALEQQPREPEAFVEAVAEATVAPAIETPLAVSSDMDMLGHVDVPNREPMLSGSTESRLEYGYSAAPRRRRSRRKGHRQTKWIRAIVLVFFFCAIALLAYVSYKHLVRPAILPPNELLTQARSYMAQEAYENASKSYLRFARRYSDHPARAEAQFNAAYALQRMPLQSHDATQAIRQRSLELYQQFIEQNPGDPKVARAYCLMGVLQFELGNYEEVIRLLRDPVRQMQDPTAALPILRKLAWAYRMRDEYSKAESTYLQAAVMPQNYTADVDYYELGNMFQKRLGLPASTEEKAHFRKQALAYWNQAIQVPGIDPGLRDEVKKRIAFLQAEPQGLTSTETENPLNTDKNNGGQMPETTQTTTVDSAVENPEPETAPTTTEAPSNTQTPAPEPVPEEVVDLSPEEEAQILQEGV